MKDYDLDLIQVLWVEDDPMVIEQYPLTQLICFILCWFILSRKIILRRAIC